MVSSSFKANLRRELRQLRDGSPVDPIVTSAIVSNLKNWLSDQNFNIVGFYLPIFHEVDLTPLMTLWLHNHPEKSAAVPVIKNNEMFFAEWSPTRHLVKGIFNTLIPEKIHKIEPDLLLVPCLGFDQDNYRLGYGGGWYDRYLNKANPRPFTVGIAYSNCALKTIKPEKTDIPLNLIITDTFKI